MKKAYTTLIAWRYMVGRKSFQAINIITGISTAGIAIGAAALMLILSVFNGFEGLLRSLYTSIYTDLKVFPAEGKFFAPDSANVEAIRAWPEVAGASVTMEETALLDYAGNQDICTLKGVDGDFRKVTNIDSVLLEREFVLQHNELQLAVVGAGLAQRLGINVDNPYETLSVYLPNSRQRGPLDKPFRVQYAYPIGRFSIKQDYDYQYAFVSLDFIRALANQPGMASAVEIKLNPGVREDDVREKLAGMFDVHVQIRNKDEQNASFFKLMNIEKWISYAVVSLTLIIVSFNLISALWMIVLDKKRDISILQAMGAAPGDVRAVFLRAGWMICAIGWILGVLLAAGFYIAQKQFGLVPVPEGFVVDSYPIELRWIDVFIVGATVFAIGTLAAWLPARKAARMEAYVRGE
jgi:lipoprotein-releasing system permease protein